MTMKTVLITLLMRYATTITLGEGKNQSVDVTAIPVSP
jgi:hypothetical protein